LAGRDIRHPERALIDDALAVGDDRNDAAPAGSTASRSF
jgi:hypothetical protein